jgi:cell wall-associated NlpC family hydrolase
MADVSVSGGKVRTPAGSAPVVSLLAIGFGGYLLWFGVKYWRGQGPAVWPSYVIKSVLQGHGLPPPQPAPSSSDVVTAYETTLGAQISAQEAAASTTAPGASITGAAVANDVLQYVGKVRYTWGGANPARGWDCSGLCNWVIGHDLSLDIPGLPRGTRFDGSTHGPDVASWLAWPGAAHVAGPAQPGDLVAWGPNAHMGIAISATDMVSALNPAQGTQRTPIAITHVGPPAYLRLRATQAPSPGGSPQNMARLLLSRFGWGPGVFQALDNLWNRESGWRATARNPSSGALGIAQALGHGSADTAGSLGNEYGAQYGLSAADARAANSGSALQQIRWGLGYIQSRYGSPVSAWAHEQQFGWY